MVRSGAEAGALAHGLFQETHHARPRLAHCADKFDLFLLYSFARRRRLRELPHRPANISFHRGIQLAGQVSDRSEPFHGGQHQVDDRSYVAGLAGAARVFLQCCEHGAAAIVTQHHKQPRAQVSAGVLRAAQNIRRHHVPGDPDDEEIAKPLIKQEFGRSRWVAATENRGKGPVSVRHGTTPVPRLVGMQRATAHEAFVAGLQSEQCFFTFHSVLAFGPGEMMASPGAGGHKQRKKYAPRRGAFKRSFSSFAGRCEPGLNGGTRRNTACLYRHGKYFDCHMFAHCLRRTVLPEILLWKRLFGLFGLAALLTLPTGCQTVGGTTGGGKDLAAVSMKADSLQQIRQATIAVFSQKGYGLDFDGTKQLTFSKRASTGSTILFGGWPGVDPPIEDRVQLYIEDSGEGDFTLHCDAFVVSDAGQGFFEEKRPVYKTRASAYRKLLEEVKKKIPQPPPTP